MNLYVKDDEIPKNCMDCIFLDDDLFFIGDTCKCKFKTMTQSIKECPLRPLSEARGKCEAIWTDECDWLCSRTDCNYQHQFCYGDDKPDWNFCPNCGAEIERKVHNGK